LYIVYKGIFGLTKDGKATTSSIWHYTTTQSFFYSVVHSRANVNIARWDKKQKVNEVLSVTNY